MKRLALFMDGTWNHPDSRTNVFDLWERTADRGADVAVQLKKYVAGVGTTRFEKLRGGAFGLGLSRKVQEGYRWLVENYQDGDHIYVFGFSRGAYTARSVVGFMSRCGLLRSLDGPIKLDRLFERYKAGKRHPTILGLRDLQKLQAQGNTDAFTREDHALLDHARRVPVEFIGVWDTVGALGIPSGKIWLPWNRSKYYFHDLDLSSMVRHAAHAVAIDEHRMDYTPSLWTYFTPDGATPRPRSGVEQRWFAGAHSNVGGGYVDNRLSTLPLAWIESSANALGLTFKQAALLSGTEHLDPVVDSFANFMSGLYSKLKSKHFRVIQWPVTPVKGGTSRTLHETIDASVFRRWRDTSTKPQNEQYRPSNLETWAGTATVDPLTLMTAVRAEDSSRVV